MACISGTLKNDGCKYTFEYVQKDAFPADYKKSANIRPKRVSDEEKKTKQKQRLKNWQQKEFICSKCNKTMKNAS